MLSDVPNPPRPVIIVHPSIFVDGALPVPFSFAYAALRVPVSLQHPAAPELVIGGVTAATGFVLLFINGWEKQLEYIYMHTTGRHR